MEIFRRKGVVQRSDGGSIEAILGTPSPIVAGLAEERNIRRGRQVCATTRKTTATTTTIVVRMFPRDAFNHFSRPSFCLLLVPSTCIRCAAHGSSGSGWCRAAFQGQFGRETKTAGKCLEPPPLLLRLADIQFVLGTGNRESIRDSTVLSSRLFQARNP